MYRNYICNYQSDWIHREGRNMKYVIFDMDGVIVDTEPEYRRRTKSFFESMGYQISEELYDLTCGSNWKHTYE